MTASSVSRKPFRGELASTPVAELLQTVEGQQTTGRVRFDTEVGNAEVEFIGGEIVGARMGELVGRGALFRLLGIVDGQFEVLHEPVAARPPLVQNVVQLLAERSRRTQEWRRLCEQAPPLSSVLSLTESGRLAAEDTSPANESRALFALVDGHRSLTDVIGQSGLDAVDALSAIVGAMESGHLIQGTTSAYLPSSGESLFPLKDPFPSAAPEAPEPEAARAEAVHAVPSRPVPFEQMGAGQSFWSLRKTTMVGIGSPSASASANANAGAAEPAPSPVESRTPEVRTAEIRRIISIDAPRNGRPTSSNPPAPEAGDSSPPAESGPLAQRGFADAPATDAAHGEPGPEHGRRYLGRYEVLCRIGRGGMGSVFLCRLTSEGGFRRLFALKLLRSHLSQSSNAAHKFLEEARLAGCIHHPNVVSVVDAGLHGEQPYLVMDYVEGGSFRQLLAAREAERRPDLVLPIVLDALAGLHAAHTLVGDDGAPLQVVHCDVSPENLLVGIDGICRLTDFGVARRGARQGRNEITHGKPGYLSPEQVTRGRVDQRADIFSMGVVLYYALTGVKPFEAPTVEETLRQVCLRRVEPPSAVGLRPSPSLDFVVMKALEREPERRYATAEEMLLDLRRIALRENLLSSTAEIAAWVRESVGRELAQRRLAVLDAARQSGTHAAVSLLASPAPSEPDSSRPPEGPPSATTALPHPEALLIPPAAPLPADLGLSSSNPPPNAPAEPTIAISPENARRTRWALVTASVLAATAVLVTLLWPNLVSKLFRLNTEGVSVRAFSANGAPSAVAGSPDPASIERREGSPPAPSPSSQPAPP